MPPKILVQFYPVSPEPLQNRPKITDSHLQFALSWINIDKPQHKKMTLDQAILATLAYHDIFDFPLTVDEIHRFLIGKKATTKQIEYTLKKLAQEKKIAKKKSYFFLRGRSKLVVIRQKRKKSSQKKLRRASFFTSILKAIPTLKLVAISGALAMGNSDKNDDIDLALISARQSLWTTRFLANIILLPFKRDPSGVKVANRACLNFFLDETKLQINRRNLYLAHEICQMKPLWDRDGTYQRFIKANSWVKKYLPNWTPSSQFTPRKTQVFDSEVFDREAQTESAQTRRGDTERGRSTIDHSSRKKNLRTTNYLLQTAENFAKNFQLWYMRSKVTSEKIGEGQLFFHPADTEKKIMGEYEKRLNDFKGN